MKLTLLVTTLQTRKKNGSKNQWTGGASAVPKNQHKKMCDFLLTVTSANAPSIYHSQLNLSASSHLVNFYGRNVGLLDEPRAGKKCGEIGENWDLGKNEEKTSKNRETLGYI